MTMARGANGARNSRFRQEEYTQQKYGADMTTRTDDTTYGFNSTAGRNVFDFDINHYPALTIRNADGEDTLDFSGFGGGSVIDLRDGHFSSGGIAAPDADTVNANRAAYGEQIGVDISPTSQASIDAVSASFQNANATSIANDWGVTGIAALNYNNISIAYGADIENAIGTAFADVIVTSGLNNTLTGNAGADTFVFLSDENRFFGEFDQGGTDTITDFEARIDRIDLSNLGIDADSRFVVDGNFFGVDIDGDGVVDQGIVFENLDYVPFADIFA
ncbi:M10 family metallopeptidase C-terminal domain-containing protein [Aurantiacibacter aquimixticola]|nr:M10 family metallopeptidase C-terminal domain-containing protein [Aurantiacibacter aquimixticola]